MKTHADTPCTSGVRPDRLRAGLVAVLTAVTLAGCVSNPERVRPPAVPAQPIGRFVLVGDNAQDTEVDRDSMANPVVGAAGGAVFAPGMALTVASHLSVGAQVATASVLGPLAVVGLVLGAARSAALSAEIRRKHGPALDELERQLAGIVRQDALDTAVAARLADRFGERFAGSARPTLPAHAGLEPAAGGVDGVFELALRGVEMKVAVDGRVTLVVTAALRLLGVPGSRVLHARTLRYRSPEPVLPAGLLADGAARARNDVEQAWRRFADEIAYIVEHAGSEPTVTGAPARRARALEIDS